MVETMGRRDSFIRPVRAFGFWTALTRVLDFGAKAGVIRDCIESETFTAVFPGRQSLGLAGCWLC
jgi:hypothetical protein